jgi:hypothetical protein
MTRTSPVVCLAVAFLMTGCTDLGLPGNIPDEESRTMPPPELVAHVLPPTQEPAQPLIMDGRLWVPSGQPFSPPATTRLRPVGSVAGQTVYTRAWDEPPYSAVFVRVETPGPEEAPSPREAMAFGHERWQEYAPAAGRTGPAASLDQLRRDPTRGAPTTVGGPRNGSPGQDGP